MIALLYLVLVTNVIFGQYSAPVRNRRKLTSLCDLEHIFELMNCEYEPCSSSLLARYSSLHIHPNVIFH